MKNIVFKFKTAATRVKAAVKAKAQYVAAVVAGVAVSAASSVAAFASGDTQKVISYSDFSPVIDATTKQFNVTTIVAVLAAAAAVTIGLVFMWWGLRKVVRMIMGGAKGSGKISV